MMLTINEITAVMPPDEKENSTMTAEPTGLFQGLAPLLVNRTVIMTVAADGKGLLTLNVIPKKVKDDESDALTTPLCLSLIHISEPTRQAEISYAVFCLKKK